MSKRIISLLTMMVLGSSLLFAQSVEQGRKFFYYERFKSARENFEKVLAGNPNDIEATYWLGQTLLKQKDSVAAKNVYQKFLAQNANAPLILVGMGEIELREGKDNDARQRFETALTLTKGKDIEIFNAIGRANVSTKAGDANYAVQKLSEATHVKNHKDPETYLLLGDAYRKNIDGGNAITNYNKALALDPKLAAAKVKTGRVYLTQNNKEFFLPNFEDAVKLDPAYAPAYFELFYYWYFRDVNKAAPYLESYTANTDQGPEAEYLKTDFLFASGKFAEAKDKATQLITQQGAKVEPRMYKLVAYAADTLQDITTAQKFMTDYFAKQTPDAIVPADYVEQAVIYSKTPGQEAQAFTNFQKAVQADTSAEGKVKIITQAAALAKKQGNRKEEANWLGIAYGIDPNPSQTDLYNWGMANYQAANYQAADSIFCNLYQTKYPDQIYGYLWCARTKQAKDTTMQGGDFAPAWEKLVEMSLKLDSAKYKTQAIQALITLTTYYNDVKKDSKTALTHVDKILQIDPANQFATTAKPILQKAINRPAGGGGSPAQPAPKKTGSSSKSTASKQAARK